MCLLKEIFILMYGYNFISYFRRGLFTREVNLDGSSAGKKNAKTGLSIDIMSAVFTTKYFG